MYFSQESFEKYSVIGKFENRLRYAEFEDDPKFDVVKFLNTTKDGKNKINPCTYKFRNSFFSLFIKR
jgi:hypothetical protein